MRAIAALWCTALLFLLWLIATLMERTLERPAPCLAFALAQSRSASLVGSAGVDPDRCLGCWPASRGWPAQPDLACVALATAHYAAGGLAAAAGNGNCAAGNNPGARVRLDGSQTAHFDRSPGRRHAGHRADRPDRRLAAQLIFEHRP